MKKKLIYDLTLVLLLAAGFVIYKFAAQPEASGESPQTEAAEEGPDVQYGADLLALGTEAPDFTLADIDGVSHRLSDFRGKKVLLVFWASWCPDCRAELPLLREMRAAADPGQVAFVSVSFDRTLDALKEFSQENPLPGLQLFDPAGKKESAVAEAYGVKWIPSLYVIGPDGKILLATVVAEKASALLCDGTLRAATVPAQP